MKKQLISNWLHYLPLIFIACGLVSMFFLINLEANGTLFLVIVVPVLGLSIVTSVLNIILICKEKKSGIFFQILLIAITCIVIFFVLQPLLTRLVFPYKV